MFHSFICKLSQNGEIVFIYTKLPENFHSLIGENHGLDDTVSGRVLAGISDAFVGLNNDLYQYHRSNVDLASITNLTRVTLTPKPTCNLMKNCKSCVRWIIYLTWFEFFSVSWPFRLFYYCSTGGVRGNEGGGGIKQQTSRQIFEKILIKMQ